MDWYFTQQAAMLFGTYALAILEVFLGLGIFNASIALIIMAKNS